MHKESLEMEVSHSLSQLAHRMTVRVRGPRPYSWISSSPDSFPNECWPWGIQGPQRCSSPDSCISSSSSSHPTHTAESSVVYDETRRNRRRRKPAGPRAPRDNAYFDVQRVRLVVNTSPSVIPRFQREDSPIIWGPAFDGTHMRRSSQMPTLAHSPGSFPLDWDAIFELLGCSETGAEE